MSRASKMEQQAPQATRTGSGVLRPDASLFMDPNRVWRNRLTLIGVPMGTVVGLLASGFFDKTDFRAVLALIGSVAAYAFAGFSVGGRIDRWLEERGGPE